MQVHVYTQSSILGLDKRGEGEREREREREGGRDRECSKDQSRQ